ncbi:MAG TPA: serine hydrolase domain-containing protein [Puia sp.]|nr:serine hydrolase domain-containing protein [Puia sp.]
MRERIVCTGFLLFAITAVHVVQGQDLHRFVDGLAEIRAELRIPAMQTAVMVGDSVLLEKTFGAPATAVFRVASITKTFTSTLIMQLVEKGKLNLDAPVGNFGIDLGNPDITVRELLTHTSEERPGSWYSYNGYRFGRLGQVLEKVTGIPYYELLMENIVKPLHMYSTAPGDSLTHYFSYLSKHRDMADFFETAHARLVRAYLLDSLGHPVEARYPDEFGAFGGLATSAGDLLKYSAAIDHNRFVSAATQREIFTPNRTADGKATPYGLGWLVENYQGIDYYWHYGQSSPGESGIFLKVPAKKLTVVVLANTDKLSTPFPLGDGDLFMSPVGQLIYRSLIPGQPADKDFHNKELIVRASIDHLDGDTAAADQLYAQYGRENFKGAATIPPAGDTIAELRQVRVNRNLSRPFHLPRRTKLRVYGVGEDCSGDHRSWCDFGWIEDAQGKIVWQMAGQPVQPAGGAAKNQRVDQEVDLPAGQYSLHYKSDWGHAYDDWDSLPPDNYFWGIILYKIK